VPRVKGAGARWFPPAPEPAAAVSARDLLAALRALQPDAPPPVRRELEAAWQALDGALRAVPQDLGRTRAAMAAASAVRARVVGETGAGGDHPAR
jgi:hypothetical protein